MGSNHGPEAIARQVDRARTILLDPRSRLTDLQKRALKLRVDYPTLTTSQLGRELGLTPSQLFRRLNSAYQTWEREGGDRP